MSNSETKLIPLLIEASSPFTEISVVDANLEPVQLPNNAGRVKVDLLPGLYRVGFREGTGWVQTFATLLPGQKNTVEQPAPAKFRTAVPLEDTSTTHESHEAPTQALKDQPADSIGDGSAGLWIVVRDIGTPKLQAGDPSSEAQPQAVWPRIYQLPPRDPSSGLTLHDEQGALLSDIHQSAKKRPEDRFAGQRFLCDSTLYRLRLDTGTDGSVEMPVVTCAGWRTQVFLICRSYSGDDRRADLSRASVSLTPRAAGEQAFDPSDRERRLAEIALQALASRRTLSGDQLDELMRRKFRQPMLGIFGAHLLCLQEPVDLDLLAEVLGNLAPLTSSADGVLHPDVAALKLRLTELRGEPLSSLPPFDRPPMLLASWRMILEASRKHPEIVRTGSLADRIADRVWGGGPWLLWSAIEERPAARRGGTPRSLSLRAAAAESAARPDFAEAIRTIRASLARPEIQQWFRRTTALSDLERTVAQFVYPAIRPQVKRLLRNPRSSELLQTASTDWTAEKFAGLLAVPMGTAERIVQDVQEKLIQARRRRGLAEAVR